MIHQSGVLSCVGVVASLSISQLDADWQQFRGPNSSGIAIGPAPPVEFGPGSNELWRVPLASEHSSPCIPEGAIFLTTFKEQTLRRLYCSTQWRDSLAERSTDQRN
jgi:outer membrane protein assembly factor BamB